MSELDDYRLEVLVSLRSLDRLDKDAYTEEEKLEATKIYEERKQEEEEKRLEEEEKKLEEEERRLEEEKRLEEERRLEEIELQKVWKFVIPISENKFDGTNQNISNKTGWTMYRSLCQFIMNW